VPHTYQVEVTPYELTLYMDKFILDDSNVNAPSIWQYQLPMMAKQWRRHPQFEIRDLIENLGIQTSGYGQFNRQLGMDGYLGFAVSRPINTSNPTFNNGSTLFSGGTYCNDFQGGGQLLGGATVGGPMGIISFSTIREYMQSIPFPDGETAGIELTAVMIPNGLITVTDFVLKSTTFAPPAWGGFSLASGQVGAVDNMLAKLSVKVIVNKYLKNLTKWYYFDLGHTQKPLRWIVREAPKTVPRVAESDPMVWDSHRFAWGGYDRVAPGWGFPWLYGRSS
jgi:Mu-like prophage major head subunit gpT